MAANEPEQLFRRTIRRLTSQYLAQRLSYPSFRAAVRDAAVEAGILDGRRVTRDERLLNALAWGKGSIEPGRLPLLLEPLYRRLVDGQINRDTFAQEVRRLLDQLKTPD